jgi:hypothetical protein
VKSLFRFRIATAYNIKWLLVKQILNQTYRVSYISFVVSHEPRLAVRKSPLKSLIAEQKMLSSGSFYCTVLQNPVSGEVFVDVCSKLLKAQTGEVVDNASQHLARILIAAHPSLHLVQTHVNIFHIFNSFAATLVMGQDARILKQGFCRMFGFQFLCCPVEFGGKPANAASLNSNRHRQPFVVARESTERFIFILLPSLARLVFALSGPAIFL